MKNGRTVSEIFLLDTNIIADYFNDIKEAASLISSTGHKKIAISVITYTEILVGFSDPAQKSMFDFFVDQCLYFSIEKSTAKIAANLKRDYRWKLPDAYQAAIAVEHKMTLLTRNTKDFNPSIHKFVKIPYKLR